MRWILLLVTSCAWGEDLYLASANTGAVDATSCASARIYTWFNTAANWGGGAGEIDPGDTVHICGTITGAAGETALTVQASGSAGQPITILFETGAVLTAPYWASSSAGAINMSGKSYIIVDGGANGVIRNTANGTGLTYQQASVAVRAASGSNIIVRNLTISTICQHTSSTDSNGCISGGNNDGGIVFSAVTSSSITGNTISDTQNGIWVTGTGDLALTISGNTISRCNWGIAGYSSGAPVITGLVISNNDISDAANWDDTTVNNSFHHNGIFLYASPAGSGYTGAVISNNYIHGTMSNCSPNSCTTSWLFLAPNSGTILDTLIYNNVLVNAVGEIGPGNGFITGMGTNGSAYNNTIMCNDAGFSAMKLDSTGGTVKNNLIANCARGIYVNDGSTLTASNDNLFFNLTGGASSMRYNGTNYATVATWTSATGFDADSLTSNPLLTASYTLGTGSPAIGAGANLSSLGITALNSDKNGVARGSSWDIGAYEYAAPPPPSTLRGVFKSMKAK